MIAKTKKQGATRKPVRQARQPIAWKKVMQQTALISTVVAIIAAAFYIQQDDTLPILHVTLEGPFSHVDKAALVKAVAPYAKGNFLRADVVKIREAGEALPWVYSIQVKRVWPDSLHLSVQEQVPVAKWNKDTLVNPQGDIFPVASRSLPDNLAELKGPETSHSLMTKRYLSMQKQLNDHALAIKKVMMDQRRAWTLVLANDVRVVLGRADSEQRFKRFVELYQHSLKKYQPQIAEMDMRYPNGLAVTWKSGQQPDFNGTV